MRRSNFIKSVVAIGTFSQVPLFFASCENTKNTYSRALPTTQLLDIDQLIIIRDIQNILFPDDGNGPSAFAVKAEYFFVWTIEDKRRDPESNEYLIKGIEWIKESSEEIFKKDFLKLSEKQKLELIELVSKTGWGRSWLSVNLTVIFEALLSDPIYGSNIDKSGWKWLSHRAGVPGANKDLKYDNFFKTLKMESK